MEVTKMDVLPTSVIAEYNFSYLNKAIPWSAFHLHITEVSGHILKRIRNNR